MTTEAARLTALVCPHGTYAVSIDGPDGGGTRVTPSKCCGRWKELESWALSESAWQEIRNLAECAANGEVV